MSHFDKTYQTNDIKVFWQPEKCIHSGRCAKGLLAVFNPGRKPWIELENGSTENIVEVIKHCPSGALSFEYKHNA